MFNFKYVQTSKRCRMFKLMMSIENCLTGKKLSLNVLKYLDVAQTL